MNTAEAMDQMFWRIPSHNLCALVDIVNMISPANVANQKNIVDDVFRLYKDRINVFHLKDFKIAGDDKESDIIGQGELELEYLLNKIKKEKPYADIILEEAGKGPGSKGAGAEAAGAVEKNCVLSTGL